MRLQTAPRPLLAWADYRYLIELSTAWMTYRMTSLELGMHWWSNSSLHPSRRFEYPWTHQCFQPIHSEHRILEAGSGMTLFGSFLSQECANVCMLDCDKESRDYIVPRLPLLGVEYHQGDVRQMPYKDGAFDRVCCISVLEHMPPDKLLDTIAELLRVTKDDGRLVLTFDISHTENGELWLPDAHKLAEYLGTTLPSVEPTTMTFRVAPYYNLFTVLCIMFAGGKD